MGKICGLVLALVVVLQQGKDRPKQHEPVQRINVTEPSSVEAGKVGPGGSGVTVRRPAQRPSLVPLRKDFNRELIRAADGM